MLNKCTYVNTIIDPNKLHSDGRLFGRDIISIMFIDTYTERHEKRRRLTVNRTVFSVYGFEK